MISSECIIFQSAQFESNPFQSLSNLTLSGFTTVNDSLNSDRGKLYGSFTYSAPNYTLNLYKDFTKLDLVATATATALGVATVVSANDSGLSGTVNFAQYTADDTAIEAIGLLAVDDDIPFNYLNSVSDYDPIYGFAEYHILAFNKIKEILVSRYRTVLQDPEMIDTRQINGGRGGYDLSRILDWRSFHEAAYHYAFAILAEREAVDPEGVFFKRSQVSKNVFKGYMERTDCAFDLRQKRVAEKSRSLATFKISRG